MNAGRIVSVFGSTAIIVSLGCCVPEEIVLQGEIQGIVTDVDSREPIPDVLIELNQLNSRIGVDTTEQHGAYTINHIPPGIYEIEASKPTFTRTSEDIEIQEASTAQKDFKLSKLPYPEFSTRYLDFGFDSTSLSFTISNPGAGELTYSITKFKDWITVDHSGGNISDQTDTIHIAIDRTGLSDSEYEELLIITSYAGEEPQLDTIDVFLNGIVDRDGNCYGIVTIGTQTWLQENLNTGVQTTVTPPAPSDNQIVEKYCYGDIASNCETYGALYRWTEMMDYSPPDRGMIGITQGICPSGWHIPTKNEVEVLVEYLGGLDVAAGKMKAKSTLCSEPNPGEKNSGFNALPGGFMDGVGAYRGVGQYTYFWTSDLFSYSLHCHYTDLRLNEYYLKKEKFLSYVRCIKDPE